MACRRRGGDYIRFIQSGGTFDYSGFGFSYISGNWADNGKKVYNGTILFNGGIFNAANAWAVNHYIPLLITGDWTLNQADGTAATWYTALAGNGDVTLNGSGSSLVGDKEVQGAVGGKWTVGAGFTAGLEGAASLLVGLDIGAGATATVDIAADRSAVFTARDFTYDLTDSTSITGRFNKVLGDTLAFTNVAANVKDLSTVLAFTNPAVDYLADVGAITVDFTAKPTRNKVTVAPAGGLTVETAAQKVRVTVDGEPVPRFQCLVENGDLKVHFASGTVIYLR